MALGIVAFAGAMAFVALRQLDDAPVRRAGAARSMDALMSGKPVGGPFRLADAEGRPRSLDDFRGKLVVLYFGFTYCPDVCPTDLMAVGDALRDLGADAAQVQPLFVTLDPARDTPRVLRSYATHFHPSFIALTGSEAEVRKVATDYKVFFEKVQPRGGGAYLIDHMTLIFVLDRSGRYLGALPGGTPANRISAFLREMLTRSD